MKLKELLENAKVSTAAENLDWIYEKVKKSKQPFYPIKKIIQNWTTELYSKKAIGGNSHKDLNNFAAMVQGAELFVMSKKINDTEGMKFGRKIFNSAKKKILEKFK